MEKGIKKEDFLFYLSKRIENIETYYNDFINEIRQMEKDGKHEFIPYFDIELMNMGEKIISIELQALKNLEKSTKLEKNNKYFLQKENS